jgi:hypothetical protein
MNRSREYECHCRRVRYAQPIPQPNRRGLRLWPVLYWLLVAVLYWLLVAVLALASVCTLRGW